MAPASPLLSVVVPLLDEREALPRLVDALDDTLAPLDARAELVLVDDGSRDGSFDAIRELRPRRASVRGIRLARNVGSQQAILCGLAHADGDAVITMDADLQHPPELIPDMLAAWRGGAAIVEMLRDGAELNGPLRRAGAVVFYAVLARTAGVAVSPEHSDFRLLDRDCVDEIVALEPPPGFLRAAVAALDAPRTAISFVSPDRVAGRSRYTPWRLARAAAAALVGPSPTGRVLHAIARPPRYHVAEITTWELA